MGVVAAGPLGGIGPFRKEAVRTCRPPRAVLSCEAAHDCSCSSVGLGAARLTVLGSFMPNHGCKASVISTGSSRRVLDRQGCRLVPAPSMVP